MLKVPRPYITQPQPVIAVDDSRLEDVIIAGRKFKKLDLATSTSSTAT